jgi:hypothetical protein
VTVELSFATIQYPRHGSLSSRSGPPGFGLGSRRQAFWAGSAGSPGCCAPPQSPSAEIGISVPLVRITSPQSRGPAFRRRLPLRSGPFQQRTYPPPAFCSVARSPHSQSNLHPIHPTVPPHTPRTALTPPPAADLIENKNGHQNILFPLPQPLAETALSPSHPHALAHHPPDEEASTSRSQPTHTPTGLASRDSKLRAPPATTDQHVWFRR